MNRRVDPCGRMKMTGGGLDMLRMTQEHSSGIVATDIRPSSNTMPGFQVCGWFYKQTTGSRGSSS